MCLTMAFPCEQCTPMRWCHWGFFIVQRPCNFASTDQSQGNVREGCWEFTIVDMIWSILPMRLSKLGNLASGRKEEHIEMAMWKEMKHPAKYSIIRFVCTFANGVWQCVGLIECKEDIYKFEIIGFGLDTAVELFFCL